MCKVWNLHEGWIPYRMAAARPPKEEITVAPGGRVRWRTHQEQISEHAFAPRAEVYTLQRRYTIGVRCLIEPTFVRILSH